MNSLRRKHGTSAKLISKRKFWKKKGEKTVSIDEMTGIQALEREVPSLPMKSGVPERRETNYIRHGTLALIAGFYVTTGQVYGVIGETRTEEDFARFVSGLIASEPDATKWHLVMDNFRDPCLVDFAMIPDRISYGILFQDRSSRLR